MKIYEVWVDNSGTLRSNGYLQDAFSTRDKAERRIEELKRTIYKNYFAEFWIKERSVK